MVIRLGVTGLKKTGFVVSWTCLGEGDKGWRGCRDLVCVKCFEIMELIVVIFILFQGIGIGFNCVAFCCITSASFWCMLFWPNPSYLVFHSVSEPALCTFSDALHACQRE